MNEWPSVLKLSSTMLIITLVLFTIMEDIWISYNSNIKFINDNAQKLDINVHKILPFNYNNIDDNIYYTDPILGRNAQMLIESNMNILPQIYFKGKAIQEPLDITFKMNKSYIIQYNDITDVITIMEV